MQKHVRKPKARFFIESWTMKTVQNAQKMCNSKCLSADNTVLFNTGCPRSDFPIEFRDFPTTCYNLHQNPKHFVIAFEQYE